MDTFSKLFGSLLALVYHCFDRIVIQGYLPLLTREEHIVHFFRDVHEIYPITKDALRKRTKEYQQWVEAFARNHRIPIEWPEDKKLKEKGLKREDYVRPYCERMIRRNRYGVYFIFKSMEQGPTFRSLLPKFPTDDPHYRILKRHRTRYTHYYFYIRDEVLGPLVVCVGSFLPFQTTYYLNGHHFIEGELRRQGVRFRQDDNAFLWVSDPQALQAAADRLSATIIRQRLEYWTLIVGPKIAGIKIHDTRMMRLMEVLLHGGPQLGGWRTAQIHTAVLAAFGLTAEGYSLTQLRYDLRKMKAHGLLQRIDQGDRYRLTKDMDSSFSATKMKRLGTTFRRVVLVAGLSVSVAWSWRLSEATPAERANWTLIGDGHGVHWPKRRSRTARGRALRDLLPHLQPAVVLERAGRSGEQRGECFAQPAPSGELGLAAFVNGVQHVALRHQVRHQTVEIEHFQVNERLGQEFVKARRSQLLLRQRVLVP
jgi:hypothetical protein